ncbi:N-acetylglucosamine-6-phosphate deacetylase [Mycoplasmopsis columboralis]|uniref:N-acetylglucosamine-6-phosphate deacetylase n=1 Tax=Mycoplasmopsis columboralis TaxID=171282 RepID=A0A449B5Y9_9BACT|nr:N-acetylglucosamine-6-phosphate deacetylase [Mycoplasmopsis columboralis]VEU75938.1 N-acetylglucosamine-6-phosphate deacetylase [Mycoplasmopsis columboralis]
MIIKNVKVVNPYGVIDNADVYIRDEKIIKIVPKTGLGKNFLFPGFVDLHVHGFKGQDFMDGKTATEEISKQLAEYGVTSIMPTEMTAPWDDLIVALSDIASAEFAGSRHLGIHLEGPFIGEAKKGAHHPEYLLKGTPDLVRTLHRASKGRLKRMSFDPKMVDLETLKEMQSLKIVPSIGHTDVSYNEAQLYFDNRVRNVCHMWNAMSGIDSRKPGLVQAAFNRNVYTEIILDFEHICPETIDFTLQHKDLEYIVCVSDAIRPAYGPDGDSISGSIPVTKKGKNIYLKGTNTIAGSGITLYDTFKNLMKMKVKLPDIAKLTSTNALDSIKHKKIGRIREGYYADLVMIDRKSLDIKAVIINGRLVKGEI